MRSPMNERPIDAGDARLRGFLDIPDGAQGLVVFAHGSGSSRFSRRNQAVAASLREARLGTLLFDLLTEEESRVDDVTREYRFDIPMLGSRLGHVVLGLREEPETAELAVGLFGSSTGAAAALIAAAEQPGNVGAVVSRGGRPDLAGDALPRVQAPSLFIVGGRDTEVLELNRSARARLRCPSELAIVPGATHLFEEPGTLEQVSALARDWFVTNLGGPAGVRAATGSGASGP